jgi:transposase-like protein
MTNKSKRAVSAMSDKEFEEKFPSEKAAIDWFIDIRYKGNLVCPHCGATISIYRERARLKVFHCAQCNNSFSPIKGTIFEKTHIGIRAWFKAIREFLNDRKGYSACKLQNDTKFTYKTAWRMLQQIRIAMSNREMEEYFEGLIEVDETYVGGKPRKGNAILDKDGNIIKSGKLPSTKRGRGTKKIPVVGVKERSTGKVYATVMLPNKEGQALTGKQLLPVIDKVCKKGTIVVSDDFKGYNILDKKGQKEKYIHVTVNHSKGQYSAGNAYIQTGLKTFGVCLREG